MPGATIQFQQTALVDELFFDNESLNSYFPPVTFQHHTNFAKQTFRINPSNNANLQLTTDCKIMFSIPNHAHILCHSFFIMSLPNIYSPIYHPCTETNQKCSAYDFRWIRNP